MVNLIWLPLSTAQVETSRCPGYEDVSNARMQRVVDISSLQIGANVDAGACGMVCNTGQIYCLPTGIIIGEYKTGTAEIRLWFKSHPHVHMASGEPSNLATDPVVKFRKYMKQTPGWRPFTPKEIRSGVIAMEKSPIYSTEYCASSRKMKTLLPSIKLILSVRDPARRAYSAFMQQCRMFLLVETHQGEVVRCDKPGSLHPNANCRALQGDRTQIFRQLGPRACNAGAFDKYLKGVKRRQSEAGITLDELYKRMDTSFNNSVCVQADRYMQEELLAHGLYSATIQAYWRHFQQMQLKVVFMGDFKKDALSFIKQVRVCVWPDELKSEDIYCGNDNAGRFQPGIANVLQKYHTMSVCLYSNTRGFGPLTDYCKRSYRIDTTLACTGSALTSCVVSFVGAVLRL